MTDPNLEPEQPALEPADVRPEDASWRLSRETPPRELQWLGFAVIVVVWTLIFAGLWLATRVG